MSENTGRLSLSAREQAIYRYVLAMDHGDLEEVAAILELACTDPELDHMITEVHIAFEEEEELGEEGSDAMLVQELLREHFPSAFVEEETCDAPLTVAEIAAQMQARRQVPSDDRKPHRSLLQCERSLPDDLSMQGIRQLAETLNVHASQQYWRAFRNTAIAMSMGRGQESALQMAARDEKRPGRKRT